MIEDMTKRTFLGDIGKEWKCLHEDEFGAVESPALTTCLFCLEKDLK